MNKTVNLHTAQNFYQNLGKLFYSISAADKIVRVEEVKALKKIVEEEWLDIEKINDEFGTDTAYQIEIIFDWLDENQPNAEEAFIEFKDYRKEHINLFDKDIDRLRLRTANEIADAFAGKNRAEIIMLTKLRSLLKQ